MSVDLTFIFNHPYSYKNPLLRGDFFVLVREQLLSIALPHETLGRSLR